MTTPDSESDRRRRRRKTKAGRIPSVTSSALFLLGVMLLVEALYIFLVSDQISSLGGSGFWVFAKLAAKLLGKIPTAIILGGLGLGSLAWGGWRYCQGE